MYAIRSYYASHSGEGTTSEAKFMLKQTLKIIQWFYSVYEDQELDYIYTDPIPLTDDSEKLKVLESELEHTRAEIKNFQEKLKSLSALSKVV